MPKSNRIVIRQNEKIGELSAEFDDFFLFVCFIDSTAYTDLLDVGSPKMILSGRTGAGKTAIIRKIKSVSESSSEIDLLSMALDYITNSTAISFLRAIDADIDIFFQILWKHVLCIEFIRLLYNVKDEFESKTAFQRLSSLFSRDDRRKRALEYLKNWEGKFWITMDENVRELTEALESKVDAHFSSEVQKFQANAGYARTISNERKSQLQSRIKEIINIRQMADLSQVLDALKDACSQNGQKKYYILIDRLDERWVDESIKYRLINALFDTLKTFRKIDNLKIIVSVRSDVLEKSVSENKSVGFQRDKFSDIQENIHWSKPSLKSLINRRINYLFRMKYTKQDVHFENIFPDKIGKVDTFDYIIDRTLMRPRDALDFVNTCLKEASQKTVVSVSDVRSAENEYSKVRLQAIGDEWRSLFPPIDLAVNSLRGLRKSVALKEIAEREQFSKFIESTFDKFGTNTDFISQAIASYVKGNEQDLLNLSSAIGACLYRVGIIGIKLLSLDRFQWSYIDSPIVLLSQITPETRVRIHPMFYASLGIDSREVVAG